MKLKRTEHPYWMRNRKLIVTMVVISISIVVLAIAGSLIKEEIAQYKQEKAKELQLEEEKRLEEEQKEAIETTLNTSSYGNELRSLYTTYPQLEEMILNLDEYPDWLVEHLVAQPESVDWVIGYPKYMKQSEEEINAIALESLNMEDYEFHNQIPIYYQWDSKWGYAYYGNENIAVNGCGPTCLSMVAVGLTGDTSYTPKKIADISIEIGAYLEDTGTTWDLMERGAKSIGLNSSQIKTWSAQAIRTELENGHPIICSMKEGDFTTRGHFIVLTGVTEEGKILINDPNSKANTQKEWDAVTLLDQMKGMWTFSK